MIFSSYFRILELNNLDILIWLNECMYYKNTNLQIDELN